MSDSTTSTRSFEALAEMAAAAEPAFAEVDQAACLAATRQYVQEQRKEIQARHRSGASGGEVLNLLSAFADRVVQGVASFALYHTQGQQRLLKGFALCALGGYGRGELSPHSDLDLCLLYKWRLSGDLQRFNEYIVPFLWDTGFKTGYAVHSLRDALQLAANDVQVMTSYAQARVVVGERQLLDDFQRRFAAVVDKQRGAVLEQLRRREQPESLPPAYRDLHTAEPDLKENVGGLRDYHVALWIILLSQGRLSFDDLERLELITQEEHLELAEGLDFLWRIRNELHFYLSKAENRITFPLQRHLAEALGYGPATQQTVGRLMQDYYLAARRVRRFLRVAARVCDQAGAPDQSPEAPVGRSGIREIRGRLCAGRQDSNWFNEYPPRLMELFWECARQGKPLTAGTERRVRANLYLVNDAFRGNELVRRFFVAICSRPLQAGFALRQMASAGLLQQYLPEFGAVQGIVRYEDLHSYPVDEHTLRAVESLAALPEMEGPVARSLQQNIEHIRDPQVLVLAILMHDLGKAGGEEHVEEGVALASQICTRMGIDAETSERVRFLVRHHMLMTHISIYRDTDDIDIVSTFAEKMRSDNRLRELLLLSYADLSAVGPNVWTEWKGALLIKLYLKAERILQGRSYTEEEQYWTLPKADEVRTLLPEALRSEAEAHLKALGERYFIAFSAASIAEHMQCLAEARQTGLAVRCRPHTETGVSEMVVCTRDRHGLFAALAGSFASQLLDVSSAALFTTGDGMVVDCFTLADAVHQRPVTPAQFEGLREVLEGVLLGGEDVQQIVEHSRNRLFALNQPRVPVRTRIDFDDTSSRSDTVIDLESGDRTGLLYDIARALAELGVDFVSARIVTDARRVRDAFYVRQNGGKVDTDSMQQNIRTALEEVLQPVAVTERKGVS